LVPAPPANYEVLPKLRNVDNWFLPEVVIEIKVADIQLSPVHSCGKSILGKNKGLGMRFPRFMRLRSDKAVGQSTSNEQIKEVFENQAIFKLK
jgi:DNA ligase-1